MCRLYSRVKRAKAKTIYFHQLAGKLQSPRDFWSQYHRLNPKHNRTPPSLRHKDSRTNSPTQKADLLNKFFVSCFTMLQPQHRFNFPPLSSSAHSSVTCNHEEVLKLLSPHMTNTASGPDGISGTMLRQTAASIAPALTNLFNLSLSSSTVPDEWKLSIVTPIFKAGDASEASNYRPISLLSLISKALERCIHSRITDFLLRNNLLADCQYDLRPKSSTQDALLTITRDWHEKLSTNRQVAAVFFDIRKAFDSVPHHHLLKSLADIGITGQLHQWFVIYLCGRLQVSTSLLRSTARLNPWPSAALLYIIFMNSITELTLYTLLYTPINSTSDSSAERR